MSTDITHLARTPSHAIRADTQMQPPARERFRRGTWAVTNGREWRPKGNPEEVRVHDFLIKELGRAVPYGIYDLAANAGWVSVGMNHDTRLSRSTRSADGGKRSAAPAIPKPNVW
jgi:hypothetical protein